MSAVTPWRDLHIPADSHLISALDASRKHSETPLGLLDHWQTMTLLGRPVTAEGSATFAEMMPLWVGGSSLRPASPERQQEYAAFLDSFGVGQRFREILAQIAADRGAALECDLGPIHDFALIERHLDLVPERSEPLLVLEIGGGYGRLAELFYRFMRRPVCYLLVDAVPESVYYSWAYLRARLPDARVGAHFNGDTLDPTRQGIHVMPAWALIMESLPVLDIACNVASLQEMPGPTVESYILLIDNKIRSGGLVFLENSREYCMRREYRYPSRWRYLLKQHSPRSRTFDYPVDILQVSDIDQSAANKDMLERYYVSMKARALDIIEKQEAKLAELHAALAEIRHEHADRIRDILAGHRRTVDTLRARVGELQATLAGHRREHADRLREILAGHRKTAGTLQARVAELRRHHAEVVTRLRAQVVAMRERYGPPHRRPTAPTPTEPRNRGSDG